MFRNLIPALADRYHMIAPDYPGFGYSATPPVDQFDYTFDHLADVIDDFVTQLGLKKYSLYVQDYGAPVGYRLAVRHPERVQALIVQNGNAYVDGIDNDFWAPIKKFWADKSPENSAALRQALTLDAIKWQYTHGVRQPEKIDPDTWTIDAGAAEQTRRGSHPAGALLLLRIKSRRVSQVARVFPEIPTPNADCLG